MGILQTLRTNLSRRQMEQKAQQVDNYRQLVVAIANEHEVDEFRTLEILQDAEKDLDSLEADVKLFHDRRKWAKQLESAESARTEIARIELELSSKETAFNHLQQQHLNDLRLTAAPLSALKDQVSAGEAANNRLRETCNNPEIQEAIAALRSQRNTILNELNRLKEDLWGYSRPGYLTDCAINTLGYRIYSLLCTIHGNVLHLTQDAGKTLEMNLTTVDPLAVENFGWWFDPDNNPNLANAIQARVSATQRSEKGTQVQKAVSRYRDLYRREFCPAVSRWLILVRRDRETSAEMEKLWHDSLVP